MVYALIQFDNKICVSGKEGSAMSGMGGVAGMQAGMEAAFNNAHLDDKTAHEECPEDVKGALLFKLKSGVTAVSGNASRVFRRDAAYDRYDLKDANEGVDRTVENELSGRDLTNPEEFPELERPPLRKIDKYLQPECPCCNISKRYTQVAVSTRCTQNIDRSLSIFYAHQERRDILY